MLQQNSIFALQKNFYDTSNFDSDFTRMSPRLTPISHQAMTAVNQADFRGFSFVNSKYKYFGKSNTSSSIEKSAEETSKATDL